MTMKRIALAVLMLCLVLAQGLVAGAAEKPRVAIVAVDRIGDRGFTDSAYNGIVRAAKDFGIQYKVFECKVDPSVYYDRILSAAENFDIVFIDPGYFFDKELAEIVPKFPNVKFVYIDGVSTVPGMISVDFKEEEGSFLAGALAAYMAPNPAMKKGKPNHVVGFVGGADWPVIRIFEHGFTQGAKYADPKVKVESVFAGTHYDPAKGKESALSVHGKGANIVFQAAGPAGLGVLEAARDADFYAIGVDIDQCDAQPGYMMASMLKRVDSAVYDLVKRAVNGQLTKGTTYPYGVKEDGVGLCWCSNMKKNVPVKIQNQLKDLAKKIASGKIVVHE